MKDPDWIPLFLPFEQFVRAQEASAAKVISDEIKAATAAKARARDIRAVNNAIEVKAKQGRRYVREIKAKEKLKGRDRAAQCGYNLYFGNSGWAKCHTCGQQLIYRSSFDIASANPQICIKKPIQKTP